MGRRLYGSLFFEIAKYNKDFCLYTLKRYDWDGYPSLFKLYLEMEDPTEYEFANTYFEDWDHWNRLCQTKWFKPYVTAWREELDLKIKSKALKAIKQEAAKGDKNKFQANKILLDRSWESKTTTTGRGRPSKEQVEQRVQELAEEEIQANADLERILKDAGNRERTGDSEGTGQN